MAWLAVPVILVDNASMDDTVSRVRNEFPTVLLLESAVNRGAVARNLGVQAARTPFVAFADDDLWWAPDAIERAEPITPLLRDSPLGEGVAGPAPWRRR